MTLQRTFSVQVNSKVLKDVHMRGVSDGGYGCGTTFVLNVSNGLCTNV